MNGQTMDKQVIEMSMDDLLEFFNPEKVFGYCKTCRNYQKMWSCPEHEFSVETYLKNFSKVKIIGIELEYDNDKEVYEYYLSQRKWVDEDLIELENKYPDSKALIPGSCLLCERCAKPDKCIYPEKMRYSLESLGMDVGGITEKILKKKLQWDSKEKREKMQLVAGLLIK